MVMQKNRYAILEPVNLANELQAYDLDIVIAPLVAFDLKGHRLGAGGGWIGGLERPDVASGRWRGHRERNHGDPWWRQRRPGATVRP